MKKVLSVIMALIMTVSLMAVSVSAAASPKLNATEIDLPIGYGVTLKVSGASGDVKWSSADSKIAEVKSSEGASANIIGKKTGETYIYAKTSGKTLKCRVTVQQSFIIASKSNIEIESGKTATITLKVKGSKDIAVSRSDKSVCSVSWGAWDGDKIKLTVKGSSTGTCDLKVYAKGYSKSTAEVINVKVTAPQSMTDQVIELVNKERKKAGKKELASDDTLNEIAEMRAEELLKKFSHTRPDGSICFTALEEAGIVNVYSGENIAAGQKSAEEVMSSWMSSSGHKANILSSNFTKIGVGCVKYNGTYYWVQVFTG
ncbi:MAG: hypothetical protein J1E40_04160 [Oscillospiraceae bacterium]|nr:hypothetical protein [Oscillospiraceae bacterium]